VDECVLANKTSMRDEKSIDDNTSSRIEILRFPLIIGVVYIHSYDAIVYADRGSIGVAHSSFLVELIRFFISQGIARVAVPLFFMTAGYLFFLGGWSWRKYIQKLKRRINTLLIPFLFWNFLSLAAYAVAQSIPQTRMYSSSRRFSTISSFSFFDYINALFGLTSFPIAGQFWFIRDLMVLVILAPAIYFLLARRTALPLVITLFFLWFSALWPALWPGALATFFFSLGAYLSRPGKDVTYLDKFGPWTSAVFVVLLTLYSVFPHRLSYLQNVVIMFGVPSAWWLTSLAVRMATLKPLLTQLSGASFFVFAAHEPLMTILITTSYKLLLPTSRMAVLALYFLIPACLIAVLVAMHRCLLRAVPRFIGFITGRQANWLTVEPSRSDF
jgi:surface polysaccharide O-acyltransferase-like enzyme